MPLINQSYKTQQLSLCLYFSDLLEENYISLQYIRDITHAPSCNLERQDHFSGTEANQFHNNVHTITGQCMKLISSCLKAFVSRSFCENSHIVGILNNIIEY